MHVGHIRSTFIGDSLARIAKFVGHNVITDNHIGDWGTQFGMIIYGWKTILDKNSLKTSPIDELVRIYKKINQLANDDKNLREQCKNELVKLQSGDTENIKIWQECVNLTIKDLKFLYKKLNVNFDHYLGESFYNDKMADIVEKLKDEKIAKKSQGAICVFFDDDKNLKDFPCLIKKSDGGYLYSTSDLATIQYRVDNFKADEIWYVVGAPQSLHFKQIFKIIEFIGKNNNKYKKISLKHIAFGSILGKDKKLMRTRQGKSIVLNDLINEAITRAKKIIEIKNPNLEQSKKNRISEIVGIGAIKYAELSQFRIKDYIFDWDNFVSLNGNTAPYLLYSYVRIMSIFKKVKEKGLGIDNNTDNLPNSESLFVFENKQEKTLALKICQFGEIIDDTLKTLKPNVLALYLYELAKNFHSFYESCNIIKSEQNLRISRLHLSKLTAETLSKGLDLLGIKIPIKM